MKLINKTDFIVEKLLKEGKITMEVLLSGRVKFKHLKSLLLKLFEMIVSRYTARDLLSRYNMSRFVHPCRLNQREMLKFDSLIYQVVPDKFEAVELSLVNPLGTNSILTSVSQKNVLSTIRGIEVIGDITTSLALECAERRKHLLLSNIKSNKEVNLCSSQRVLRVQSFEEIPGFTPHFKVFGACTAGRNNESGDFELKNLLDHTIIYLDLLSILNENGYSLKDIIVSFSDIKILETLIDNCGIDRAELIENIQITSFDMIKRYNINLPSRIGSIDDIPPESIKQYDLAMSIKFLKNIQQKTIEKLKKKYPNAQFQFDLARINGIGYYTDLCFKITAKNKEGKRFPLVDGGIVDWTQKLLNNNKERLFTSGFGSELFCRNFKR